MGQVRLVAESLGRRPVQKGRGSSAGPEEGVLCTALGNSRQEGCTLWSEGRQAGPLVSGSAGCVDGDCGTAHRAAQGGGIGAGDGE